MGEALKRGFQIQVQTDYSGTFNIVMELEGRSPFFFFFPLTEIGRLGCVGAYGELEIQIVHCCVHYVFQSLP